MMNRAWPTAAVLLAGILWGIVAIFVRELRAIGLGALQICALRTVGSAFMLLACTPHRRRDFRVRLRDLPLLAVCGMLGMMVACGGYFVALTLTSASVAVVLLNTAPVFILIVSALFLGEKMTRRKILSLVMVFVGCVLVSGLFGGGGTGISPLGFAIGLASGFAYAMYSVLGSFLLRRYSSVTVNLYAFAFGGLFALLFADFPRLAAAVSSTAAPLHYIGLILLMAFLCSYLPFRLYMKGLSGLEAGEAGILACVEPLVGTLVSLLVFREWCGIDGLAGIILILSAVLLLGTASRTPAKEESPEINEKEKTPHA